MHSTREVLVCLCSMGVFGIWNMLMRGVRAYGTHEWAFYFLFTSTHLAHW